MHTTPQEIPPHATAPLALRFEGRPPPTGGGHAALRRSVVEVRRQGDGSLLVQWPADVVALRPGPADAAAPTDRAVPNVVDWLPVWAGQHPGRPMLAEIHADGSRRQVDYDEAWRQVRAIGATLLALGTECGSAAPVLAVVSGNSLRQALLTFAAMYVGWAVAPISPAYAQLPAAQGARPERLAELFRVLQPDFVYAEHAESAVDALDRLEFPRARCIDGRRVDAWAAVTTTAGDEAALRLAHTTARGECVAKIMFTSGSTGVPKGVPMTHAMLAAAQATSAANLATPPAEPQAYLDWLPWHHVMGSNVTLGRLLRFGGTLYIDGGRPAPGKFDETLRNLRGMAPSFYFSVPLGYAMLVPALEQDEALAARFFSRLEYLSFGGASLSADLVGRLRSLGQRHTGRAIPITSAYGATETSGPGLSTSWDMDSGGALGLPAPGVVARLVPLQDRYELRLAGANIAHHYLDGSPAGRDEEGYYRTGDAVAWIKPEDPLQGLAFAGRVSEEFKLLSGTWVNVGVLRQRVVEALAPFATDAVLTGHDRAWVGALLFMNERSLREHFPAAGAGREALATHPDVLRMVAERLGRLKGGSSMRVERALLMAEGPVAEAFEITDKGYTNQRAVLQRRAALVEALHAETAGPGIACARQS